MSAATLRLDVVLLTMHLLRRYIFGRSYILAALPTRRSDLLRRMNNSNGISSKHGYGRLESSEAEARNMPR
jgi:hypothetical protein